MLCYYIGRFVSPLLFKSYSTLSKKDQREWDVRSVAGDLSVVWEL